MNNRVKTLNKNREKLMRELKFEAKKARIKNRLATVAYGNCDWLFQILNKSYNNSINRYSLINCWMWIIENDIHEEIKKEKIRLREAC